MPPGRTRRPVASMMVEFSEFNRLPTATIFSPSTRTSPIKSSVAVTIRPLLINRDIGEIFVECIGTHQPAIGAPGYEETYEPGIAIKSHDPCRKAAGSYRAD